MQSHNSKFELERQAKRLPPDFEPISRNALDVYPQPVMHAVPDLDASAELENGDELDIQEAVARLAALSPIEYMRRKKAEAKRLGVSARDLEEAVRAVRKTDGGRGGGVPLSEMVRDPEPWHESVGGAELLDAIVGELERYLSLQKGAADSIALWIALTYFLDEVQIVPRLCFLSPDKRCGKTTAMSIVGKVAFRPFYTSNISPAALYRVIEDVRPTLFVDEGDTFLKGSFELRGILNSGHSRPNAYVTRCVGDSHEARNFSTYAAIAFAAIGGLWDTIEDRSLVIPMQRQERGDKRERLRLDRTPELDVLARKSSRWAEENRVRVGSADPDVPKALHARAADNWRPLLAIADAAGGEWPERARRAAALISGGAENEALSDGAQLLADMRRIFNEDEVPFLETNDILQSLIAMEECPWSEYGPSGKPLSPAGLAKMLRGYGINPHKVRRGDSTLRGYARADFEPKWRTYLPPIEPPQPPQL